MDGGNSRHNDWRYQSKVVVQQKLPKKSGQNCRSGSTENLTIFQAAFFVFLLLMILYGATISNLAHGDYFFLLAVAALDFTIAVALLGSSHVFWKR
jgi:hypothetical protein